MGPEIPQPEASQHHPSTGDEDAAFLGLLSGLHRQIEAHRLALPAGVHAVALIAMQRALVELGAAATDAKR